MNHLGLFSGIGGFEKAFRRAGANLIGMCEIEPRAQRVLRRHFSGVRIINDVKAITRETVAGCPVDLITGGFPCQDLSVAGHRKGLDGERSGLWFEYLRIIADHKPRWVVIENVPGLLSSYSGADPPSDLQEGEEWEAVEESDFAILLRGLVELGYGIAWRVFDSQFDGVAQRRERVFIVASLGDASCAEVLFERESSAWDSPPSREAWQDIANTVTTGSGKSCGPKNGNGHPLNLITGTLSPGAHPGGFNGQDVGNLIAFGGNNQGGRLEVVTALRPKNHQDFESATFLVQPEISHTLTSEGYDASEDGTGRGTPIIAFTSKDYGHDSQENITPTLRSMNFDQSHINGGGQLAIAYPLQEVGKRTGASTDDVRCGLGIGGADDPMYTLQAGAQHGVVAFTERTRAEGRNLETQDELAYALTNPGSGGRTHSRQIAGSFGVRRLTPRECERLQGFPDGWTERGDDGREISDSARYRMLGNAVCLPTVEWIARRIMKEAA